MNEYTVHCTFLRPDEIYHVTVMPCYDKKLEASREDFYNDIYRTRDVDCVITSGRARIGLKIVQCGTIHYSMLWYGISKKYSINWFSIAMLDQFF